MEAGVDLVLFGAGVGGLNGTLIVIVQNAVGTTLQGVASAGMAFTRILSGAVAVAVVGAPGVHAGRPALLGGVHRRRAGRLL